MRNRNEMSVWNDNTWRPLTDLRREMDRLFDDFWPAAVLRATQQAETAQFVPACDVEEQDGHYLLTLEMPGVSKDDIKVEVIDNQIVVSGERRHEKRNKENGAWYSERRFGKFSRAFTVPAGVDAGQIEAGYQDGVLRLMVPKAESAKPRQIKITQGSGNSFFGKILGQPKAEKETDRSKTENVA